MDGKTVSFSFSALGRISDACVSPLRGIIFDCNVSKVQRRGYSVPCAEMFWHVYFHVDCEA